MSLYLTALIKSKPDTTAALKELLQELVAPSRKDAACLQYDLHQSTSDPQLFIFQEEWESREGLLLHNSQPYILKFREALEALVDVPVIIHYTQKLV